MRVERNDSDLSKRYASASMMLTVSEVWNVFDDAGELVTHVVVDSDSNPHRAYKYLKQYRDREIMDAFLARGA